MVSNRSTFSAYPLTRSLTADPSSPILGSKLKEMILRASLAFFVFLFDCIIYIHKFIPYVFPRMEKSESLYFCFKLTVIQLVTEECNFFDYIFFIFRIDKYRNVFKPIIKAGFFSQNKRLTGSERVKNHIGTYISKRHEDYGVRAFYFIRKFLIRRV